MPITVGTPIKINGIIYDVERILGKGGLSLVYLAQDQQTGEKVAIKEYMYNQFYDPYTHENDCESYWENEVLNTQAQARSGLKCVHVLNYEKRLDLQTPEFYIVLSYIQGQTFLDFYREFILTCKGLEHLDNASIVRNIFLPLAELLHYCHSVEHIVHRDFSVNNIIIQKDEMGDFWPILIDWGLSKYLGPELIYYSPKPFMVEDMPKDIPINQKGAPPEIRFGYIPVAASDIYYFGHLMYFVFTGGISREGSENIDPESYVLHPKEVNWFVPNNYDTVVEGLTAYEPADRPKDMAQVIKKLKRLITIDQIHFDFEFFMDPDTDPVSGKRLELKEEDTEKK